MSVLDAVAEFCGMVEEEDVLIPETLKLLLVLSTFQDVVLVSVEPSTTTEDEVAVPHEEPLRDSVQLSRGK